MDREQRMAQREQELRDKENETLGNLQVLVELESRMKKGQEFLVKHPKR